MGAQSFSVATKKLVQDDDAGSASGRIDYDSSVNPSGLKLGLTRATGLLSGSFVLELRAGQCRRHLCAAHKNLVVQRRLHAARHARHSRPRDPGEGFYLLSDKDTYLGASGYTVTYTFSRSFRFALFSEASHDTTWCDGEVTHE